LRFTWSMARCWHCYRSSPAHGQASDVERVVFFGAGERCSSMSSLPLASAELHDVPDNCSSPAAQPASLSAMVGLPSRRQTIAEYGTCGGKLVPLRQQLCPKALREKIVFYLDFAARFRP